jgi:hypothetical protein
MYIYNRVANVKRRRASSAATALGVENIVALLTLPAAAEALVPLPEFAFERVAVEQLDCGLAAVRTGLLALPGLG